MLTKLWFGGLLTFTMVSFVQAQSFTYQGYLRHNNRPANAAYDFRFRLWTASTGGSQVGPDRLVNDLNVNNGHFTVELNFGAIADIWTGADRFLEIAVRLGTSTGGYQELAPRVKINPTPYSFYAFRAPWSGLVGIPAGFADGIDNDTTYSAGAGLQLSGTTFSIATGGVGTGMLADLSVTTVKIANGAVNDAKLSNTGVTAGTYGSATQSPQFTVNAQGRITSVTNVTISGVSPGGAAGGDLSGTYPNPVVARLQGRAVHNAAPQSGAVLKWNALNNRWEPSEDLRDAFWQQVDGGGGIYYSAGRVGIGTVAPFFPLEVQTALETRAIYVNHAAERGFTFGVYARNSSSSGTGIYGYASSRSGETFGIHGESGSSSGIGVFGDATATTGNTYGVYGRSSSTSGRGVTGEATARSGTTYGVSGRNESTDGVGVFGRAYAYTGSTYGVYGRSDSSAGTGVFGWAAATSGVNSGVYGRSDSTTGYGVFSEGRFAATGTKSFQIDHPLRPETHYLNHFCFEGPEPQNIYNGVVMLDAWGEAWVSLPDYFEAINRDPRYTLTPVGAPMPNLHVAAEIQGNRFKIAGGAPGKKVSWRVEAIRNDRWVQEYGFKTEQEKEDEIKGKYVNPELYGQPKERGLHYRPEPVRPNEGEKPK